MEELAFKQLTTLGLAGLVIFFLGFFSWKMVALLLSNSREYIDSLKSTVVNNTKAMESIAPRLDRIEDALGNVPCEFAARSNDLPASPPPSQRGRRAAPSSSSPHILVSGGE